MSRGLISATNVRCAACAAVNWSFETQIAIRPNAEFSKRKEAKRSLCVSLTRKETTCESSGALIIRPNERQQRRDRGASDEMLKESHPSTNTQATMRNQQKSATQLQAVMAQSIKMRLLVLMLRMLCGLVCVILLGSQNLECGAVRRGDRSLRYRLLLCLRRHN